MTFEFNVKPGFAKETELVFIKIDDKGPETIRYRLGSKTFPWKIKGHKVELTIE